MFTIKKYDVLIFDLDNTLFDFNRSELESLKKLFINNKIEFNTENVEHYRRVNKILWDKLEKQEISKDEVMFSRFTIFFNEMGLSVDGKDLELEYRSYLNNSAYLLEGAYELLESLQEQHYCLFAATNGLGITQRRRLIDSDLLKFFDKLYISEEVGFEKPNLEFFDTILTDNINFNKNRAIMIGDSLSSDIEGACRFGIDSCWLNFDTKNCSDKPTYTITDIKQLKELLY